MDARAMSAGNDGAARWIVALLLWVLALTGVAFALTAGGVVPVGADLALVVGLLALGGILWFLVGRFVEYFDGSSGRVF